MRVELLLVFFAHNDFYWISPAVFVSLFASVQMFDMIYASVLIFLLTAIGILGTKSSPGSVLLVPLLVGAIVWRIVIGRKLARPLKEMSMHTAADLDRQDLVRAPLFCCVHLTGQRGQANSLLLCLRASQWMMACRRTTGSRT